MKYELKHKLKYKLKLSLVCFLGLCLLSVFIAGCGESKNASNKEKGNKVESQNELPPLPAEYPLEIPIPSLKEVFKDYFLIGAGIDANYYDKYEDIITYHFNSLTAGNVMKFDATHPGEGKYTFDRADAFVQFAEDHGKRIRGHTLVWHNQTPAWVFSDSSGNQVSREILLERMRDHIFTVMGRYKGKVEWWDVVNEAVSDSNNEILRSQSPWYRIIGDDFVKKAFEFAYEADPDAKLFYNDYSAVEPGKRDRIYKMLKEMIEEGIPINGIGIQGHWNLDWPSENDIRAAIEKYASLGLEIHITELDLSFYGWNSTARYEQPPTELLIKQADKYQKIFQIFKDYRGIIKSVTFWGVADDDTWLDNYPVRGRKNWPLLFDTEHRPKESFWRIVEEPVLSMLSIKNGTLTSSFVPGNLYYKAQVDYEADDVEISLIAGDPNVKVKVRDYLGNNIEASADKSYIITGKGNTRVFIDVEGYGKTNTYILDIKRKVPGIAAEWKLDEGTGHETVDSTGRKYKGAIQNAAWIKGISGKAVEFAGDSEHESYIDFGSGFDELFQKHDFSISLWVKPGSDKNKIEDGCLLWYGDNMGTESKFWRILIKEGDRVFFHLQQALDTKNLTGSQYVTTPGGTVKKGEWNHIVCVRRGDTLEIYVNGNIQAGQSFGYTIDLSGAADQLFACLDKAAKKTYYHGAIDEIRIYNYPLSQQEIEALYSSY